MHRFLQWMNDLRDRSVAGRLEAGWATGASAARLERGSEDGTVSSSSPPLGLLAPPSEVGSGWGSGSWVMCRK